MQAKISHRPQLDLKPRRKACSIASYCVKQLENKLKRSQNDKMPFKQQSKAKLTKYWWSNRTFLRCLLRIPKSRATFDFSNTRL
jgi:hypothetical protein